MPVGTLLTRADFVDARRLDRMVRQRYVRVVAEEDSNELTVAILLDATIYQLRKLTPSVTDAETLRAAMAQDERSTAQAIYRSRLQEVNDGK